MKILFLCTGNSCRSIMAEALLNQKQGQHQAWSAGSHPAGQVHPLALATLTQHNISTAGLYSKSWDDLNIQPDLVVTLCSQAAGETCPAYLGKVHRAHWGMDDPSQAVNQPAAFESAFQLLRRRIDAFLALSAEALDGEHISTNLQKISAIQ